MAWFYPLIAGLTEITRAIGRKYTDGFPRLWPIAEITGLKLFSQQPEIR